MKGSQETSTAASAEKIILFDGVCNLCNGFVQFVIKHDKNKIFKFGALQSAEGQKLLKEERMQTETLSSIVLIDRAKRKTYTESSAVLRIFRSFTGLFPLLYIFSIIPKFIRDFVYRIIARNRYKWFGEKDACMIPTPENKKRFL